MVVAIDGPAGAGKSTIARAVAERAGFLYLNSGSFYRAITLGVLRNAADRLDRDAVIDTATHALIEVRGGRIHLDGVDVESELHRDEIDALVSQHSSIPQVRDVVNRLLRATASRFDVVIEGRDISTVVFPDAELKIYLDASLEERAKRRYTQGVSSLSLGQIEQSIRERDERDRNKPHGSLRIAADALYVDTSHLTIEEVCEKVVRKIRERRLHSPRSR